MGGVTGYIGRIFTCRVKRKESMIKLSFPACKVPGDYSPVKFRHLTLSWSIPAKCAECDFNFEGECTRNVDWNGNSAVLDFGSCKQNGSTEPIARQNRKREKKLVPTKCDQCKFLRENRNGDYICTEDRKTWGKIGRSLDWGEWRPDFPPVGIGPDSKVSRDLILLVQDGRKEEAIELYIKLNGGKFTPEKAILDLQVLDERIRKFEW